VTFKKICSSRVLAPIISIKPSPKPQELKISQNGEEMGEREGKNKSDTKQEQRLRS
jgi:hypothetical protein